MNKLEMYEAYQKISGLRIVAKKTFCYYLDRLGGYDNTIAFLNKPKKTVNSKKGTYKKDNVKEIIDFAKLYSVDKASKQYGISSRTIYRYINNK